MAIVLFDYQGGTWVLQYQNPNVLGDWQSSEIEFSEAGDKDFYISDALDYRLTGGTAGASAWLVSLERK